MNLLRNVVPWLVAIAAVAFLAPQAHAQAQGPARKPNIVFILADDLGYGDPSCFGQTKLKTPSLDRLAQQGLKFTQFYAGSTVCAPSRCVLMTGLHTGHCFIRGNARHNLRPEDLTVAEILHSAGYATALIGKWGLGQEGSTGVPTRQGFDEFFGYLDQHHAHNFFPSFLMKNETRVPLRNVVPGPGEYGSGVATTKVDYSPELLTQAALAFIRAHQKEPFFLYLAYTLPHANNEGKNEGMEIPSYGPFAERDWPNPEKGFAAMLGQLDSDVGKVLNLLKELGLEENTLVIFSSDNGPHREGGHDPDFFDSNGPLRGIKRDLFEGGIRVPTIIRWPGQAPAGQVRDDILGFVDVLPTLAEVVGQPLPSGLDGRSFLPAILGKELPEREYLYWEFYEAGFSQAVRIGRWKAIRLRLPDAPIQVYDLETDLGETTNVAGAHPEIVARARALFAECHVPSPLWSKTPPKGKQKNAQ